MQYEKVLIRLLKPQLELLRTYAKEHGTTVTMIIRMAVDKFVNEPKMIEFKESHK